MLKKFHKYPIILTSNGKKIGIMEFHKDVFREFDNLKIYQEQELLIDLSVSDCLRLDLPTEFGIVNFVYFKENEMSIVNLHFSIILILLITYLPHCKWHQMYETSSFGEAA